MIKRSRSTVAAALVLALLVQSGCGTILYPQRRGQRGGRVDAGVAVLDGIGLLFFILPGVIAFAVDFGNGTIYLPAGGREPFSRGGFKTLRFDARHDGVKDIERLIRNDTGIPVALDQRGMRTFELNSSDELPGRFAIAAAP
jgi:hypothetical protein